MESLLVRSSIEYKEVVLYVQLCHIIDANMEAPTAGSAANQSFIKYVKAIFEWNYKCLTGNLSIVLFV